MSNDTETKKSGFEALLDGATLASVELRDLVEAFRSKRLRLPAIQRSLVWDNKRIIDYWDTLLRGWFPGLMLVHEPFEMDEKDENALELVEKDEDALELFDGQQRLATILLGFGEGPFAANRRLWIEVGGKNEKNGAREFALRISSMGQPFGYQRENPNTKLEVSQRRKAFDAWIQQLETEREPSGIDDSDIKILKKLCDDFNIDTSDIGDDGKLNLIRLRANLYGKAFEKVKGINLCNAYNENSEETLAIFELKEVLCPDSDNSTQKYDLQKYFDQPESVVDKIKKVMELKIPIFKLSKDILRDGDYQEFFGRVGQGGVALSNDERSYSLIKHRFRKVRQVLEGGGSDNSKRCDKAIGRLASPTQIALAAFRVARMAAIAEPESKHRDQFKEWDAVDRPKPPFLAELPKRGKSKSVASPSKSEEGDQSRRRAMTAIAERFEAMFEGESAEIIERMKSVRDILDGTAGKKDNTGFPAILLGRLPPELIDIVLMLGDKGLTGGKEVEAEIIRSFCLWILCFGNAQVAAYSLAKKLYYGYLASKPADGSLNGTEWSRGLLKEIIDDLVNDDKASRVPTYSELEAIECPELPLGSLAKGEERFNAVDPDGKINKDNAKTLNNMRFNSARGRNTMLWLQRDYLKKMFPGYDPTSDRDEDLPIDLDHIVASKHFNFHWTEARVPKELQGEKKDLFRAYRSEIGNLIGNLRYLASEINRSRKEGGGEIGELLGIDDLTSGKIADMPGKQGKEFEFKEGFDKLIGKLVKKPTDTGNDTEGAGEWRLEDIQLWQELVLRRSVILMQILVAESGIEDLIGNRNEQPDTP